MVVLGAVTFLSLVLKLLLASTTVGTNDVTTWADFADLAQRYGGAGLYQRDALFNHPPFMVHVLGLWRSLERHTGVPFPFWVRLPAILADPVTVALVWRLLRPAAGQPGRWAALILLTSAPPLIMISVCWLSSSSDAMCRDKGGHAARR